MSAAVSLTEATPSMFRNRDRASISPLRACEGRSILRHVAGNDDLRAAAHAGQEHFHLRDGGVLGLVENDEGFVERPAAHVCQGNDFDQILFRVAADQIVVHHFVQGVQQGRR